MKKFSLTVLAFFVVLLGLAVYGMIFPASLIGATFLTITDGVHTVIGVQKLTVTGGTVGGSHNAATLTITGGLSGMNAGELPVAATASTVTSSVPVNTTGTSTVLKTDSSGNAKAPVNTTTGTFSGAVSVGGNLTTNITGSTECVHANTSGVLSGTGSDCGSGGGGTLTTTDGTHSVANTTTQTLGNGLLVGGSAGSATIDLTVPHRTVAGGATIGAADMSGILNISSTGTVTIPAISSTVFASGMTTLINNISSGNVTVSSTPTINGCSSPIPAGGWAQLTSNGTSLDCFGSSIGANGLSGMTATQLPVAATATTVTSSVPVGTTGNSTVVKTSAGGTIDASLIPQAIHYGATSQTISATQWKNGDVFVVLTAGQTLTLPVVTGLATSGGITIITLGPSATVTLQPNAADGINGNSVGSSVVVPIDIEAKVTTSGSSGTSALTVPLGPPERFMLSWGAAQNLSTPGSAGIPIARIGGTRTISAIYCNPSVVVGGAATFDVYAAPSATALGSGTKLNASSCDANTGAGTEQSLGVASASVAGGSWIGIVASGTGWSSSSGWGAMSMTLR